MDIRELEKRISTSKLSIREFFNKFKTPCSIAQFYRYRLSARAGSDLSDKRVDGNNRKLSGDAERLLKRHVKENPSSRLKDLREMLHEVFGIDMSVTGISQSLKRLNHKFERNPKVNADVSFCPCAGLEIIFLLAYQLGWGRSISKEIIKKVEQLKNSSYWKEEKEKCFGGRNKKGQFTAKYNQRKDVRKSRFSSVSEKRLNKRFQSMSIVDASQHVIERKCMAIMVLPVLTDNGSTRTVNNYLGNALSKLCGINYKQGTLNKFVSELKYLGISEDLIRHQVSYWQKKWANSNKKQQPSLPLLCYYVDGNTKAFWSKMNVKKNKVTMLGKVMGCLEQVFVHDNYGRPLYFETYSGHAPIGEYILEMFDKIENELMDAQDMKCQINRAIVMDGANNSVKTLRAFSLQNKYHYITSLDDNQWKPRKILKEGRAQRYRHGSATLKDCSIELTDSKDKGFLVVSRAIKIEWDTGKTTVLLSSLDKDIFGASNVVQSYFERWPCQELRFKDMKAGASINRVAGYGKQLEDNPKVKERQITLLQKISVLKKTLKSLFEMIDKKDIIIDKLIKKERKLRNKSKIINGKRKMSTIDQSSLDAVGKEIRKQERDIQLAIKPQEKKYNSLKRLEKELMQKQGKEQVYCADVELDQIMTSFRVGFVNICGYFSSEILKGATMSLHSLVQNILMAPGVIKETNGEKEITIERNMKDKNLMSRLSAALKTINKMMYKNMDGKIVSFRLGKIDSHLNSMDN